MSRNKREGLYAGYLDGKFTRITQEEYLREKEEYRRKLSMNLITPSREATAVKMWSKTERLWMASKRK